MFREGLRPPDPFREVDPFEAAMTNDGVSLKLMSGYGPLVVVCLPPLARAKKVLKQVAERRPEIETKGQRIVLVHRDDGDVREALEPHDLYYVLRIADPDGKLYDALGLTETKGLLGAKRPTGAFVFHEGAATARYEL
ncbi:MAG: hypothetical protein ACYTGN_12305 [Planctomycetota bacterium]|jgi:hypothetical protein